MNLMLRSSLSIEYLKLMIIISLLAYITHMSSELLFLKDVKWKLKCSFLEFRDVQKQEYTLINKAICVIPVLSINYDNVKSYLCLLLTFENGLVIYEVFNSLSSNKNTHGV